MSTRIPNVAHFVFGLKRQTTPFHLVHYLCIESCRQVLQPDLIHFHYHYEPHGAYWDRIRPHVSPIRVELSPEVSNFRYRFRDRGCRQYRYAHHSDFVRMRQLLAHGGFYADIDTIFINPIPDSLFEESFVLGREDDVLDAGSDTPRPSLCNAFIMSKAGAPFGRLWIDAMGEAFDGSWSGHSTKLPYTLSTHHPDLIHVEPARTFYRHMWTREGLRTLFEGHDADTEQMVSLHLWSHLWWSRRRRDFSAIHADMLTEEYIRHVDTTYNVLARRFLP